MLMDIVDYLRTLALEPPDEEELAALFGRIDNATRETLTLLGQHKDFHSTLDGEKAIDLELVLLGLPHRPFAPKGMQKRINQVEPITAEQHNEKLAFENKRRTAFCEEAARVAQALKAPSYEIMFEALKDDKIPPTTMLAGVEKLWREKMVKAIIDRKFDALPFVVETENQRGIALQGGHRLKIIDDGIGQFMSGKLDRSGVFDSALYEIAMYRAFSSIAQETLPAKTPAVRELRQAVNELTFFAARQLKKTHPELHGDWRAAIKFHEAVYRNIFENKKIKEGEPRAESKPEAAPANIVSEGTPAITIGVTGEQQPVFVKSQIQ